VYREWSAGLLFRLWEDYHSYHGILPPYRLAGTKAGNKGWDAMISAMEMADLFKQIG
jgi:hypothetical protein